MKYFLLLLFFFCMKATPLGAIVDQDGLSGPVQVSVLRVIDGDSFDVSAKIWIDQTLSTRVRILGIDTPELRGKCGEELALAQQAKSLLERLLSQQQVVLKNIKYGKYAGRVLADVETSDGVNVGAYLVQKGVARHYHGGKRTSWCR